MRAAYQEVAEALEGAEAYVTYGNADRPGLLRRCLPPGVRFVDGEVVEIEGLRVGIVGGGAMRLGVPGEVPDEDLAGKLAGLGPIDVLCTHAAPGRAPVEPRRHRRPEQGLRGGARLPASTTARPGTTSVTCTSRRRCPGGWVEPSAATSASSG